jgi:hypothetical protein
MKSKKYWILGTLVLIAGAALLAAVERPAQGHKVCEDLKAEIRAKIEKRGVKQFSLDILPAEELEESPGKVVGTCDGGSQVIVYTRG